MFQKPSRTYIKPSMSIRNLSKPYEMQHFASKIFQNCIEPILTNVWKQTNLVNYWSLHGFKRFFETIQTKQKQKKTSNANFMRMWALDCKIGMEGRPNVAWMERSACKVVGRSSWKERSANAKNTTHH